MYAEATVPRPDGPVDPPPAGQKPDDDAQDRSEHEPGDRYRGTSRIDSLIQTGIVGAQFHEFFATRFGAGLTRADLILEIADAAMSVRRPSP